MIIQATKVFSNYGGAYVEEYTVIQDETLRDKFAMAALTGLLNVYADRYVHEDSVGEAYLIADMMMKERTK